MFKTEALYPTLGKTKVKTHQYTAKVLAERAEWFIPYYNNDRKKDGLGHMAPAEYRKANPKGTYPRDCGQWLLKIAFDKEEEERYTVAVT